MMVHRTQLVIALLLGGLYLMACVAVPAQPTNLPQALASAVPEAATATSPPLSPTVVAATSTPTAVSTPARVDLDAILPPGEGKDLMLSTCGNCHPWVCAIKRPRSRTNWSTLEATHRGLIPALTDEEYDLLWAYLAEHFNESKPTPSLPPEFQQLECARGI